MTTFARGLAALVLAVAGILTMTVPAQAVGEVTVTGQITAPDGAPAAGARVRLLQQGTLYTWLTGAETTTDADGRYSIHMDFDAWYDACVAEGSPDCRYDRPSAYSFFIVSEKTGFTGAVSERLRSDVAEMHVDQQLKPPTGTIVGTVKDSSGAPLAGVTVRADGTLTGTTYDESRVTDQSGHYTFEVPPTDSVDCELGKQTCMYVLDFDHSSYASKEVPLNGPLAGQTRTVDFAFSAPVTLPPAPTEVKAGAVHNNGALRASVSYTPVEGIKNYIARCEPVDGGTQYWKWTYTAESPLIVGTLTPGASYRCRVSSSNEAGETSSPWTLPFVAPLPPAPTATNVTMTQIARKSAEVSFTDSSSNPAASTVVVRCRSADRKVDVTVTGTTSPVIVDNLRPGQTYQCYVTITNDGVTGERSAPNRSYYMHRSFE